MRKRVGAVSDRSEWWSFIYLWSDLINQWIKDFKRGDHHFSPMMEYKYNHQRVRAWHYLDRLIMHLIYTIIKPTFKHVISPLCLHLKGPSIIKQATQQIKSAIATQQFNYFLRIDIKSYYASIDHKILVKQVEQHYDDPKILKYLKEIITIGIDVGGNMILPTKGIPLSSTLSPFFGALYLSALDKAFNQKNMFYLRYQDDIIVLAKTKRQYTKARKKVFSILRGLRLRVSSRKTSMGVIEKGFHYLGVDYKVARTPCRKHNPAKGDCEKIQVAVNIHSRTSRRALEKVKALRTYAVHTAQIQRYLIRWATWWHHAVGQRRDNIMMSWVCYTKGIDRDLVWVGRGLLPWTN